MNEDVRKKFADRFALLKKFYDIWGSQTSSVIDAPASGKELGFPAEYSKQICEYLAGEGLIKIESECGEIVTITHRGIKEVEAALTEPDKSTEHFPMHNTIINHGTMQTQFVQGAQSNAIQTAISNDIKPKAFWEKYGAKIVIGVISTLIASFLIYMFGWNR